MRFATAFDSRDRRCMPRYYFDADDGEQPVRDDTGVDYESLEAAERAAIDAVIELGTGKLRSGARRDYVVVVRDSQGDRIRATLSLRIETPPNT